MEQDTNGAAATFDQTQLQKRRLQQLTAPQPPLQYQTAAQHPRMDRLASLMKVWLYLQHLRATGLRQVHRRVRAALLPDLVGSPGDQIATAVPRSDLKMGDVTVATEL